MEVMRAPVMSSSSPSVDLGERLGEPFMLAGAIGRNRDADGGIRALGDQRCSTAA